MDRDAEIYDRPHWDETKARKLRGALVLIGLTYCDAAGNAQRQVQYYGIVTEATEEKGISIECHGETFGGEIKTLPPDLRAFHPAPAGSYRLRSTGETIVDPHFTASWTIEAPKN
jgi:hypothetical protein